MASTCSEGELPSAFFLFLTISYLNFTKILCVSSWFGPNVAHTQEVKHVLCYREGPSEAAPYLSFFWLEDFGNEVISTRMVLDNEALGDAINSTDPGGILTRRWRGSISQRVIMKQQKYLFPVSARRLDPRDT